MHIMQQPVRIAIHEIAAWLDRRVELTGWVESRRSMGRLQFVELRDGLSSVQVVFSQPALGDEVYESARQLNREAAVAIVGRVRRDERAHHGVELEAESVRLIGDAEPWPFSSGETSSDQRLARRHLYVRTRRMRAILSLRARVSAMIRRQLDGRGFLCVDAPIFTPNVVEEANTLFETSLFSRMSYLSQSGQLYNEAAIASLGSVYSFGPVFRAERDPTHRHLAEFWMVEPEMPFVELAEMMAFAEDFVRSLCRELAEDCASELETLGRDPAALLASDAPFEELSYEAAVELAQREGVAQRMGDDLSAEAEEAITRGRRVPVWVVGYPSRVKPFYMKRDPLRPERTLSADLLAPEGYGEVLGGGQREDSEAALRYNLREEGLSEELYEWYLELRRYGSVPHSGFGLGLERALAWLLGLRAIDETIPFARLPGQTPGTTSFP